MVVLCSYCRELTAPNPVHASLDKPKKTIDSRLQSQNSTMGHALSVLSSNQVVNYAHAQNMGLEVQFARFPKFPVSKLIFARAKDDHFQCS